MFSFLLFDELKRTHPISPAYQSIITHILDLARNHWMCRQRTRPKGPSPMQPSVLYLQMRDTVIPDHVLGEGGKQSQSSSVVALHLGYATLTPLAAEEATMTELFAEVVPSLWKSFTSGSLCTLVYPQPHCMGLSLPYLPLTTKSACHFGDSSVDKQVWPPLLCAILECSCSKTCMPSSNTILQFVPSYPLYVMCSAMKTSSW